jgi:hypothetical protein
MFRRPVFALSGKVQKNVMDISGKTRFSNPNPEIRKVFSQSATDPYTIIILSIGIGCWLTEKRLGSRNSEFDSELTQTLV